MPAVKIRPNPSEDLIEIIKRLSKLKPDYIYGESLHTRGSNMKEIEFAFVEKPILDGFDEQAGKEFKALMKKYKLKGTWWPAH